MSSPQIEPHKITRPIQLLAVWIAGLVLLVGAFLTAAAKIQDPTWLPAFFGIAAVALVPLFVVLIFVMQTRFREQLQDDPYYSDWLKRRQEAFRDFAPENIAPGTGEVPPGSPEALPDASDLEAWRISRYEQNQGLFLVHTWRPSHTPGQVADIVIRLSQHGDGPLARGEVEKVEYNLGPKFFRGPVIKTNAAENFQLEVSAYGPMLCVARVFLRGSEKPIELERYINFEDAA
jgi:hypothetical protein